MNNADKPAYPIDKESNDAIQEGWWHVAEYGLTKREEFAKENFAALLSEGGNVEAELEAFAKIAVEGADALLKALEEL